MRRLNRPAAWAALILAALAGPASGQEPKPEIVQAGCTSCGSLPPTTIGGPAGGPVLTMGPLDAGEPVIVGGELDGLLESVPLPGLSAADCGGQCGEAYCFPGRKKCYRAAGCGDTGVFGFFHRLHDAMCCPDPCYEPQWVPAANAGLFLDYARPRTVTRFRWNGGRDLFNPDRNAYYWARLGAGGPAFRNPDRLVQDAPVDYDELTIYNETAVDNFSFWIELAFRSNNALNEDFPAAGSGFGDMKIGTKSLLLDADFIQTTFQFATHIPTGAANKGLGRSLVALEPSLLTSIRLDHDTWMQGQVAQWIPLGGDSEVAGSLLHYHVSFNRVLYRPLPDVQVIGMGAFGGYALQAGGFSVGAQQNGGTQPVIEPSNGDGAFYLSPGVRMSVCDKIDFGFGGRFMLTDGFLAEQLYRFELRILF